MPTLLIIHFKATIAWYSYTIEWIPIYRACQRKKKPKNTRYIGLHGIMGKILLAFEAKKVNISSTVNLGTRYVHGISAPGFYRKMYMRLMFMNINLSRNGKLNRTPLWFLINTKVAPPPPQERFAMSEMETQRKRLFEDFNMPRAPRREEPASSARSLSSTRAQRRTESDENTNPPGQPSESQSQFLSWITSRCCTIQI